MDVASLQTWVPILLGLINLGGIVWVLFTSQSKSNATEIRDLQKTINSQAGQIRALEQTLQQMPGTETVHALDLKVSELNGTVAVVAMSLQAVERTAHRIENFLLDQAKK